MPLEGNESQHVLARFDAPAFVRRAREVDDAWQAIDTHCRSRRDEWLQIPQLRLATLLALSGDWSRLGALMEPEWMAAELQQLFDLWRPRLRRPVATTSSTETLRDASGRLIESFQRFNRRWRKFVAELPIERLNELREAYNRNFLLEKECAVRSPAVAREGFQPLPPVQSADLLARYPFLPEPVLREFSAENLLR